MSYSFDGSTDFLSRFNTTVPFTGPSGSIVAWVKNVTLSGARTQYASVVSNTANTNYCRLGHSVTAQGQAEHKTLSNGDGIAHSTTNQILTGVWQLVGGVFVNGSLRTFYLGNVGFDDTTVVGAYSATPSSMYVGMRAASPSNLEFFNGKMAYLAYYTTALTPTDFTNMLLAPPQIAQGSGLAAYYKFDVNKGAVTYADDVGSFDLDNSGAAFDVDMPSFGSGAVLVGAPAAAAAAAAALSTGIKLAGAPAAAVSATGVLSGNRHTVEDLVMEASTSSGTADMLLAGAVAGYRAFGAVLGSGDTCYYMIQSITAGAPTGAWEIGVGTYNSAGGGTLVRSQVIRSSNANAKVSLPAGTSLISLTTPSVAHANRPLYDNGVSGAASTIDWANGPYQKITLNAANPVLNMKNMAACPRATLQIFQDAIGGRVPSIPGMSFPVGQPPVWSTAGNDIVELFFSVADATLWAFQRYNGRASHGFESKGNVANFSIALPAGWVIEGILLFNATASAITGGLNVGTSPGFTDVAAGIAVPGNADLWVPGWQLSKVYQSRVNPQPYYFQAAGAWNSAQLSAKILAKYTAPLT